MSETITLQGSDYTSPVRPMPTKLTISAEGTTTRAATEQIQKYQNQINAWNVLEWREKTNTARHNAHGAMYQAMGAEANAATALVGAMTSYINFETSTYRYQIAEGERNLAQASVQVETGRQQNELEKLRLQAEQVALETNKLRDDTEHVRIMNTLNGYNVEVKIPETVYKQPEGLPAGQTNAA